MEGLDDKDEFAESAIFIMCDEWGYASEEVQRAALCLTMEAYYGQVEPGPAEGTTRAEAEAESEADEAPQVDNFRQNWAERQYQYAYQLRVDEAGNQETGTGPFGERIGQCHRRQRSETRSAGRSKVNASSVIKGTLNSIRVTRPLSFSMD